MSRFLLFSFSLCIFLLLDNNVSRVFSLKGCTHKGVNYTECDLMFWTSWSVCDGSKCPTGKQQRLKGVCCPKVGNITLQETKENCTFPRLPPPPPPRSPLPPWLYRLPRQSPWRQQKVHTCTCTVVYYTPQGQQVVGLHFICFWPVRQSVSLAGVFFSSAQLLCSRFTKCD